MRIVRLFLFFVAGFVLVTFSLLSTAETINATSIPAGTSTPKEHVYAKWNTTTPTYPTAGAVCDAFRGSSYNKGTCADTIYAWSSYGNAADCKYIPTNQTTCSTLGNAQGVYSTCPAGTTSNGTNCVTSAVTYTCPTGQNWTLSGSSCTRPDCAPGETRQSDGTCLAPCPIFDGSAKDNQPATKPANCTCPSGTKWFAYNGCRKSCDSVPVGGDANAGFDLAFGKGASTGCFGGCEVQPKSGGYDILKDGSHSSAATYTGWSCAGTGTGSAPTTDGQPQPDSAKLDPTKKKEPVCGSGEGVITSSSGNVMCLPAGTPNTSTPKVEKKQQVETFPDNSTKTTTTTSTTDPNTGATDTRTTTTGTGGQSGAAGTSTSKTNSGGTDGNGDGDGDGDCDPTLHFCGGPATEGIYTKKDKTFQSVLDQFQTTVKGSSIGSATTTFFNVNTPSGGCPGWVVTVPYINYTISGAEIFCNGSLLSVLHGAGAVMLALATYIAFTWAFL